MSSTLSSCNTCSKTELELGTNLKRCAKCHKGTYCSRDCQKADWKAHKPICRGGSNGTTSNPSAAAASSAEGPIASFKKPFHALHAKKWLHDRPERDVYKLLIDTYRFRMEDNYSLNREVDEDGLYGGAINGLPGFRRFMHLATTRSGLLPPWWSSEKQKECESLGMDSREWSDLACAVEKDDIIKHYGDPLMPMQLRMLGEQVYGTGPGGQGGAAMMSLQMEAEKGNGFSSVLSLR